MKIPFFSWLFLVPTCTLFLNLCVFVASHQCLDYQRFLLLELKNNLKFNSILSTKLTKWNQSVDCCSWEGVTCNKGCVIGLDLADEAISGGLDNSSSLFNLQHLQSLSLAYNDFNNSQIPSEFDRLANLNYLDLSFAGFAGQIPIAISRLTRLVTIRLSTYSIFPLKLENPKLNVLVHNLSKLMELYLDGIHISEQGNEWCQALSSSLPNLRVLSLSSCNLSGPIESSLRNLQSLSIIHLDGNNFSTPFPEFFADFKNLTYLDFFHSGLNGKFPKRIFQAPTLQTLDLSFNKLLEVSLPEFSPNGSLQTLILSFTNFSGSLPTSIGNLKMLSTLDLRGCNFIGSIPDSIASLTQLVYLEMSNNSLSGSIPDSIASLTQLVSLDMSNNNFSGSIPDSIASLTQLAFLYMSNNNFSGSIPYSFESFTRLVFLDMSDNGFSGSLPIFSMCKNLTEVTLSNNHLSGQITSTKWEELLNLECLQLSGNSMNGNIPISLFSLPSLQKLDLSHNQFYGPLKEFSNVSSCKLKRNQSRLSYLDLSYNQIHGEIPNWLWKPIIAYVDLSYNCLVTLEGPILNISLINLNLRSNQLQGQLPIFSSVLYLDLSNNNFHSFIPTSIDQSLDSIRILLLASNQFNGSIPRSVCNATNLELLDLSKNSFSGTIPQCLIEMSDTLGLLNLRTNNLSGTIPDAFPSNCGLQTLALNKNHLLGGLPKSLANCSKLEVFDIGYNHIEGTFPFYLKSTSMLRVLVLRSNKFYGPITHPGHNATWPMLQIVDIASNNFTGGFPIILLLTWIEMMDRAPEAQSKLGYLQTNADGFYYRDTITVTVKGFEVELVKILTIFTTIDFSCNGFDGPIPEEIGELNALYILNLSYNAYTGQIPSSLGKLSNLESLDLSSNKLSGKIPVQLADGLIFLSILNLSFNQLVGQIPFIKQFATFSETSFEGNERLCGFPLKSQCTYEEPQLSPPTYEETHSNSGIAIEWNYISAELGFIFGFGIVIGPLMFWKRWRIWYYIHVDNILFRIFPRLYLGKEYHRRCRHRNQRPRH